MKKIVLLAFVLVLLSTAVVVKFIGPVEAQGTIYIRADGSVDPDTAPISTVNNVTYTFTDNIFYDSIFVQRDDIVVDGANYTLQGAGSAYGIYWTGRSNVTIKNMKIKAFELGILFRHSSNITISGNDITNNVYDGIRLLESSNYTNISGNNITNNSDGILLTSSSNNTISGNNITENGGDGILLTSSSNNTISGNNIETNNESGIELGSSSNNNSICENNITNNGDGAYLSSSSNNSIYGNNITANNNRGMFLVYSSNYNSISGNNITNNEKGISFYYSSNNSIYHNNFINNTNNQVIVQAGDVNIWDDGAGKGNYWSDYEERYTNATEIDGSGIWDTPYEIDENNQDNYPIVPEFPTWTSTLLIVVGLTVALAIYKRRLLKTPIC